MISVFLTRKPRLGEVKEEPQLVNARAGTQAQTGWLQCALMHLLCIKKLIYMSNAVRWLPTRLCVYYPLECQVLHWVRSFSLHHDQFFLCKRHWARKHWWIFRDSCNLSEQGRLQYPRDIGTRAQLPTGSPGASFPVVPACLHTGSWKAWRQPHPGLFLSRINKSPMNSKGRSQMKALSLNGVGKVEIAQSFLFLHLPVEHWTIGAGGSGSSSLKLLQAPRKSGYWMIDYIMSLPESCDMF